MNYLPEAGPSPISVAATQEMHFLGPRRSGNHAVLGWIMANAEQNGISTEHFNDIHDALMEPPKEPVYGDAALQPSADKQLTIYSYQDINVEDIPTVGFYTAAPETKQTVRIVRDLPNLIASRIAMYDDLDRRGLSHRSVRKIPLEAVTDMWVGYARDYVERSDPRAGSVNFPLWFQSREYRDEVFDTLGLGDNQDAGLNNVADFGFGSSFDYRNFDGRAQEMGVLERWRKYEGTPIFERAIVSHPDAPDLIREFDALTAKCLAATVYSDR
ncbi:MAG: hypothetical protein JWP13_683 [Candidatus Saccharibacteria bacterium]|nr:hypothetical protein [Candidatus Saccharibacteria bacterium]